MFSFISCIQSPSYLLKGILNEKGFLKGPPPTMDARFGMAISAIPDLDLDGFNDVVVGAPLEEKEKGVIYIYNGKRDMSGVDFSQVQYILLTFLITIPFYITYVCEYNVFFLFSENSWLQPGSSAEVLWKVSR